MFKNFILFCMISFTLLYRSTMQIVFPNMQAALDHIKEHKGREVLIVDSHDGSKYDSGKWPYTQFNCIINRKPSKDVKSTRKDPNSCDIFAVLEEKRRMCAEIEFKNMVFFKVHSKINNDNNLGLFTIHVNNSLL